MIIVMIKWKIVNKQEKLDAFLHFWKQESVVQDRKGLMGEFLSEIGLRERYDYTSHGTSKSPRVMRTKSSSM